MFPVIEHKALSAAPAIIGPECNRASEAKKKIFVVCFISLFLFPSFPNFLLYLPLYPALWFHVTAPSLSSQHNDSLTRHLKVCGGTLRCERL